MLEHRGAENCALKRRMRNACLEMVAAAMKRVQEAINSELKLLSCVHAPLVSKRLSQCDPVNVSPICPTMRIWVSSLIVLGVCVIGLIQKVLLF